VLPLGHDHEPNTTRSARRPGAPPAAAPARVRVGGKIGPPRKVRHVRPVYPDSMRAAGIEGKVALEAIIGRDGSVQSANVVSGLVHPDLGRAASDAVKQWRFEPTTLNGEAVEVAMNVAMTFELEK
jgi:protein TonB